LLPVRFHKNRPYWLHWCHDIANEYLPYLSPFKASRH
jgi:hypothetical protein